ncbi:MAG TPA: hypothetical protein VF911_09285 [Thermoanaerobaculia bacterium]|jgi:hypothetical protein
MIEDPIVEEVHRTRERLLKTYPTSEERATQWREIEREFSERVVRLDPKVPVTTERKIS